MSQIIKKSPSLVLTQIRLVIEIFNNGDYIVRKKVVKSKRLLARALRSDQKSFLAKQIFFYRALVRSNAHADVWIDRDESLGAPGGPAKHLGTITGLPGDRDT